MKNQLFIISVSLCVITHIVRTVYEILKHKNKLVPSKLSFVIVFSNMFVLWISWIALCSADIYRLKLPDIVNYLGLFLFLIGVIIFLTALFTIKTLETYYGDLITKGIYSKIRHPMYLGFIFWLIAAPIFFGSVFSFILSIFFIGNVLFWRYLEELELDKRFPEYKVYKTKTIF
jgi:protein-S-isoprenylcysteine O-methyltransferase Ste14